MNLKTHPKSGTPKEQSTLHPYKGPEYEASLRRMLPVNNTAENRDLISEEVFLNWSIENIISSIELINASIAQATSALQIANSTSPEGYELLHPDSDEYRDKPWELPNANRADLLRQLKDEPVKQ